MASLTSNLKMNKYDGDDKISPAGYNDNFDILDSAINNLRNDYIVAQGIQNGWIYRRWNSGIVEQWKSTGKFTISGKNSITETVTLPVPMKSSDYNVQATLTTLTTGGVDYWTWISLLSKNQKIDSFELEAYNDSEHKVTIAAHVFVMGTWK